MIWLSYLLKECKEQQEELENETRYIIIADSFH
ncbi:hypothetical protein PUATCC27989T_05417 [Phytobacter ursingii]|nr:hypothetical protein PUATCC27989T_05417 [Phytobacter ursingii]